MQYISISDPDMHKAGVLGSRIPFFYPTPQNPIEMTKFCMSEVTHYKTPGCAKFSNIFVTTAYSKLIVKKKKKKKFLAQISGH